MNTGSTIKADEAPKDTLQSQADGMIAPVRVRTSLNMASPHILASS